MTWIKSMVARSLYQLCYAFDCVPGYWEGRWHRYGDWGCWPLRISTLAMRVDPDP